MYFYFSVFENKKIVNYIKIFYFFLKKFAEFLRKSIIKEGIIEYYSNTIVIHKYT